MYKNFMLKIKLVLLALISALLLAACSQVAEVPREAPELALESASTSPYTEVSWYKGEPYKNLISTNQGFCYLAGVQGNFDSDIDQATVFISQGNYGLTGSNTEWAKAICVNWSALKINYNAFTPVRWLSDEFYSIEDCGSQNYANAWFGDAVTYLTGVGGNLAIGGGAFVIQSSKGNVPSQLLSTKNCGSGSVYTRGRSMFFGKPHINDMPQFWGPKAQGKTYSLAGYYYVQSDLQNSDQQSSVEMAPTDKAFCYLQSINGNYNNKTDWAWIYRSTNSAGKEVWKLAVKDADPVSNKFVGATAACYMLSQN
jgi:hypothetical protein